MENKEIIKNNFYKIAQSKDSLINHKELLKSAKHEIDQYVKNKAKYGLTRICYPYRYKFEDHKEHYLNGEGI